MQFKPRATELHTLFALHMAAPIPPAGPPPLQEVIVSNAGPSTTHADVVGCSVVSGWTLVTFHQQPETLQGQVAAAGCSTRCLRLINTEI